MAAEPKEITGADTGTALRTGPIGRTVRLVLAAAGIWFTYHVWVRRGFIIADPEPVLTALAAFGVVQAAGLFGRVKAALTTLAAVAVAAGALALIYNGRVWAPPLSWLAWGLDISFLAGITVLMLVAVVVGTPGCEIGVLSRLVPRLRRETRRAEARFCLIGLHVLDAWEARQRWR